LAIRSSLVFVFFDAWGGWISGIRTDYHEGTSHLGFSVLGTHFQSFSEVFLQAARCFLMSLSMTQFYLGSGPLIALIMGELSKLLKIIQIKWWRRRELK
jgi:hypothetical protein